MNTRFWITLAFGLLGSCGLSGCVNQGIVDKIAAQEKTFEAKQKELESKLESTGAVVYTTEDVPAGSVFKKDQMEERQVDTDRVPIDAMTSIAVVQGRKSKFDIPKGQIISQHDIAVLKPWNKK
ncbi:hypothetical protein BH10CYA1_BH10CYA1_45260 [soil metagenome]